jgi:hypothetical protein
MAYAAKQTGRAGQADGTGQADRALDPANEEATV